MFCNSGILATASVALEQPHPIIATGCCEELVNCSSSTSMVCSVLHCDMYYIYIYIYIYIIIYIQ